MPCRSTLLFCGWLCISIVAADNCSVVPTFHSPADYPVPARLWDSVSSIFEKYKVNNGLCNSDRMPILPSISFHKINVSGDAYLWTIVIDPDPKGPPKGAVLCRSPYGPTTQNLADIFVLSNKYVAVLQDDRGTWKSTGEFDMWRNSAQDGLDSLNWIAQQPWSNGDVYTVGASADGISSATLIFKEPKVLKSQWFIWMTTEGHDFIYPQGGYRIDIIEDYLRSLDVLTHKSSPRVISEVRHNEPWNQWWYNLTGCRNLSSPVLPQCHYQQVHWPVILSVGWWDLFQMTQLHAWRAVAEVSDISMRNKHVLFVGPLGHCSLGSPVHPILFAGEAAGLVAAAGVSTEFFAGDTAGKIRSKVGRINLYIMGAFESPTVGNYWTSLEEFPTFKPTKMYLSAKQALSSSAPTTSVADSYTYDPRNPTPMLGGTNLPGIGNISVCGTADQKTREERPDVLTFTTDVLLDDTAVVGNIFAKLFVSSSAVDTDFFVTINDVRPRGLFHSETSYLVRYGVVRMRWRDGDTIQSPPLANGKVYEVEIDCGNTAYVFPKGHQIRVTVSSAAAPYLNPTSNTGKFEMVEKVTPVIAHNSVHYGGATPSNVLLPVVDIASIPKNQEFDNFQAQSRTGLSYSQATPMLTV